MTQAPSPMSEPLVWNLVTDGYVSENVPHFTRYAADAVRMLGVGPGMRVGDVACGPGTLSFVATGLGARVRAIDFAEDMITRLKERAARDEETRIEAEVGDGQALPWPDAQLDAVFSMFGLIFFPDREKGFRELHRVLKPQGKALVASWVPFDRAPAIAAVFEALQAAMPNLPFGAGKAPLGELSEMQSELEAAGFRRVETRQVTHVLEAPSADAFWESMKKSLAPVVLLQHKLGDAFQPIGEKMLAHLRSTLGQGAMRAEMTANFGLGVKE